MKKVKISTQLNYVPPAEMVFTEPSLTVPDLSLTPQEILIRFAQGRSVFRNKNLSFTGDHYAPDVKSLDLIDYHELLTENADRVQKLDLEVKRKLAERNKKRQQDEQQYKNVLEYVQKYKEQKNNANDVKEAK